MSKVVKLIFAIVVVVGATLIMLVALKRQSRRPILAPEPPEEMEKETILLSPVEWSKPTLPQGRYHDSKLGYSLEIPAGWEVSETYPGVFRSPDEEGLVGYADVKGMVITVNKHSNVAQIPLRDWFSQEDLSRYLLGEPQQTVIAGRPVVQYEANWDVLGHALGVFIAADDQIFQIDCFHLRDSSSDKERCQATLSMVLKTLKFDSQE